MDLGLVFVESFKKTARLVVLVTVGHLMSVFVACWDVIVE